MKEIDLDTIDAIIKDEEVNGCSICPDCKTTYTNYEMDNGLIDYCPSCGKCFEGDCEKVSCGCDLGEL
tara:strand:+ start:41 stop:244 length:204 start_codon:yes stop_codon:yes gene_type:complete